MFGSLKKNKNLVPVPGFKELLGFTTGQAKTQ
jgi:hypothetical protein